jgi:hypothetical protein
MRSFTTYFILPGILAALTACGGGGGASTEPPVQGDPPPKAVDVTIKSQFGQAHILAQNKVAAEGDTLPVTSAGSILATPVSQFIGLNRTEDGLFYYGWSDEAGTYLIDPADLDKICANSFQVGLSINGNVSRACAAPDLETNTVALPGTCNRDVVFYTAYLKSTGDVPLWMDLTSERKFTIDPAGLPGVVLDNGGQINWGDYQGATFKGMKNADGTAKFRFDFGSNCAGGFGKNDHLVDIDTFDLENHPLAFNWNADTAGADGKDGWGYIPWTDKDGNVVAPSAHLVPILFDEGTGNFYFEFPNLPCQGNGNVTGLQGTKHDDGTVTYDPEQDEVGPFGFGWFAGPPIWTLLSDPSVTATFDTTDYKLKYSCN